MFTTIRRIIISGTQGFYRNLSVSLSAVLVIAIALGAFASMYFASRVLEASIVQLENKVDINVYFSPSAHEEAVLAIKSQLEEFEEVAKVEYIDRATALENFKEFNQDNPDILEALTVLGEENPLGASFNIRAQELSEYAAVARFLDELQETPEGVEVIDEINYNQNKKAIEKIQSLIDYAHLIGAVIAGVLSFLAVVVVYNTIRLTIYTVREEVAVMRLVGASHFFARGPFIVEGVLYGFVGSLAALLVLWPVLYYIAPTLNQIFVLNVYELFTQEAFMVVAAMMGMGIGLGLISSFFAIRKYLDI